MLLELAKPLRYGVCTRLSQQPPAPTPKTAPESSHEQSGESMPEWRGHGTRNVGGSVWKRKV